jgi:hypothetical protein
MAGPEIMDICAFVPSDDSSFQIAFLLHEISTSDLELDLFDNNVDLLMKFTEISKRHYWLLTT